MKTRSRDPDTTHGLPPPPAPTARDANPWTLGGGAVVGPIEGVEPRRHELP